MPYKVDKGSYFAKIGYEPFAQQWEYHNSTARFRIPSCGRRFGKTTMAARDREASLLKPNTRGWIIGPTYSLGAKEFRVMWQDLIVGLGLGKDKRVRKNFNERSGEMYIRMPWGSSVEVKSAQHPEQLVGDDLDWVIFSEAAKHDIETFERYVRPALSDRHGEADFPSTPEGFNFFYELWRKGQNPNHPEYESWRYPSWLNTQVFPGGYDDPEITLLRETTTHEWFLQEIAADFASFVGKIFSEFNEETHVQRVPYLPHLPNYIVFDWGFVNPLAAVEFQVTPDDTIRVWREHYKSYETLDWHLNYMRNRRQPDGYHITCTFGDAADPAAVAQVNRDFAPCIADPEAKMNWLQGINLMKRFIKLYTTDDYDDSGAPIQRPKYIVDHGCPNHIKEMLNYRSKDSESALNEQRGSVARKVDDHTVDAMRYGLMHIYELGTQHHLTDVYDVPYSTPEYGRAPVGVSTSAALSAPVLDEPDTFFNLRGNGMSMSQRF